MLLLELLSHFDRIVEYYYSSMNLPAKFPFFITDCVLGMWGVPPRNNLFTGREEQLTQLHDKLFNQPDIKNNSDINQSYCGIKRAELGGIGGVGKTQLSVEPQIKYE